MYITHTHTHTPQDFFVSVCLVNNRVCSVGAEGQNDSVLKVRLEELSLCTL